MASAYFVSFEIGKIYFTFFSRNEGAKVSQRNKDAVTLRVRKRVVDE